MSDPQLSRRSVITGGLFRAFMREIRPAPTPRFGAAATTFQQTSRSIPVHRPPGAVAEARFLAECTRCGDCRTACPHQAITLAPERMRAAAGTPMIVPAEAPCLACPDTPCITACKPKVLTRSDGAAFPVMATAHILTHDCLAHQGTTCVSCSERCPIPGALHVVDGKPVVNAETCVGCGVCAHVCPAPRPAVAILPRGDRS